MSERKANLHERATAGCVDSREVSAEPQPGAAVEKPVVVTLQEAYHGTTRLVELAGGRRLEVTIPPGVDTGTTVRYTGYGRSRHKGGSPRNLYLVIAVQPCPGFERRGNDLYYESVANLAELALGTEVRIRTLDGRILSMTVPAGTQPGQRFRLAGQGMPHLGQIVQRGDLYVTVNTQIPSGLEKKRTAMKHANSVPNDAKIFMVGIGAGLLLYWLFIV